MKLPEVIAEAKQGLPGFNVLSFQFIPFKTATWLLLAAYVPTQGEQNTKTLSKLKHMAWNKKNLSSKELQSLYFYHQHPPVSFAKFRLQEADAIPCTSVFLLQSVKSINNYNTKAIQIRNNWSIKFQNVTEVSELQWVNSP